METDFMQNPVKASHEVVFDIPQDHASVRHARKEMRWCGSRMALDKSGS